LQFFRIATAFLLSATLDPAQADRVRAAYEKLGGAAIEAKPAAALPEGVEFARIDVTPRMRSTSFGHTTTLMVPVPPADAGTPPARFWVQYGKSTNAPARLFGPFPLTH
jgi:hypothetical protein